MPEATDALVALVRDVKTAVQNAQMRTPGVVVTAAELEIKTTLERGPSGGFSWGPLTIGAHYTSSSVQTLHMKLTPVPAMLELMSPASDALTDGIAAIAAATQEAAASQPRFGLDEATISLNFGVDANGRFELGVGGAVTSENVHTLTLTLKVTKP